MKTRYEIQQDGTNGWRVIRVAGINRRLSVNPLCDTKRAACQLIRELRKDDLNPTPFCFEMPRK